jgi:hypothetical protein
MAQPETMLPMMIGAHLVICMGNVWAQAVASCSASPSNITFGSVLVGSTNAQTITLTNDGIGPVAVLQVTASGAGFTVGGLSLPRALASGQNANFSAAFTPASTEVSAARFQSAAPPQTLPQWCTCPERELPGCCQ